MEYIKSKDIYLLTRDILKLIYKWPMDHGSRVAYMVYKMLQEKGGYEEFELADFVMVATMHDIGAYKTERGRMNDVLRFENRDTRAHTIYGYLFFKYLSPVPDLAKIIMYHHMDYEQLQKIDYPYKEVAAYINIAEKMDIYSRAKGSQFDMKMFQKLSGTKLSPRGLECFYQCQAKYDLFGKINMVYLFGKKSANVYTLLALIFIFLGTTMSNDLVWELSDMLNQLMVIPNAIALLALTSHVVKHSHTPDRLSGRENG